MGGPTGVGDAYGTRAVFIAGGFFQSRDLAFGLIDGYLLLVFAQQGNASRVVSAVFKPVKARNQYRVSPTLSYISYYSTHKFYFFIRFDVGRQAPVILNNPAG